MDTITLPVLVFGMTTSRKKSWCKQTEFKEREVRIVRQIGDILGRKDTVMFVTQAHIYELVGEQEDVLKYADSHNIRAVIVS